MLSELFILPPYSKVTAMLDEITAKTMPDCILTKASIKFIKNVLPVPPAASKRKILVSWYLFPTLLIRILMFAHFSTLKNFQIQFSLEILDQKKA